LNAADINPTVTMNVPNGWTGLEIGQSVGFNVYYNATLTLHDQLTVLSGPLGNGSFEKLGGKDAKDDSGEAYIPPLPIQTRGQIGLELNAILWTTTDPLTKKDIAVKKTFKINPAITGDLVTVSTDPVNVGDTKDVTVTVKMPSGVERNNGKVVLKSYVPGMFTVPTGAIYQAEDSTNSSVVIDAIANNINITGGNYVFKGLKFNHTGSVDVLVYDGDGNLSAYLVKCITVNPRIHTLTADVNKLVAGQIYPQVKVSGAVPNLSFKFSFDPAALIDNGDGTYIFDFSNGIAWKSEGLMIKAIEGDDVYQIVIPIVKPVVTITSVHKDGLITDGIEETVTFKVTDPLTGAAMIPTTVEFNGQVNTYNLEVSKVKNGTSVLGETVSIKVTATKGNNNVDYKVDKPNITLHLVINKRDIYYPDLLTVAKPSIEVIPADLKLYVGVSNKFSVVAKDAHGVGLEGQKVYVRIPGGTTRDNFTVKDGTASFEVTPPYQGEGYIYLGADNPDNALAVFTFQIVKDTTPPTLTVTAPVDGSTVNTATVKVKGTATDNVGVRIVAVNDMPLKEEALLPDGSFATEVQLDEGANTIVVKAFDAAGNVATKTIKVTYQKSAPTGTKTGTKIVLKIGSDIMAVNDKVVQLDAAPEIKDGRTFLPLRAIAEAFGAQVNWVPETQGITVVLGNNQIGLQIGNNTAVVNGNVLSIVPPYIKNGRTMVPLRVIAEGFGAKVEWDPINYIVTITMP
jgi:hypothetical protein